MLVYVNVSCLCHMLMYVNVSNVRMYKYTYNCVIKVSYFNLYTECVTTADGIVKYTTYMTLESLSKRRFCQHGRLPEVNCVVIDGE